MKISWHGGGSKYLLNTWEHPSLRTAIELKEAPITEYGMQNIPNVIGVVMVEVASEEHGEASRTSSGTRLDHERVSCVSREKSNAELSRVQ